jgi:tRNA(Ser,Leu) C12 N-acetylase TAN1
MDLLVSHDCGRFGRAKHEILTVLRRLGDDRAQVRRSGVDGIALVHTGLDGREVIRRCRELQQKNFVFEFALKWAPVDYWCDSELGAIRALLESKVRDQIAAGETWGMQVAKHRWEQYHTQDLIAHLAPAITRKVDLRHPDKLVRIDVVGRQTAISVLQSEDVFSVRQQLANPSSEPRGVEPSRVHHHQRDGWRDRY